MKKVLDMVECADCGACLSVQAEICAECGYPHTARKSQQTPLEETDSAHAALKEYRMLQGAGLIVVLAGILAAAVDSRLAAAVALTIGIATYLSGLLGAWWNRRG